MLRTFCEKHHGALLEKQAETTNDYLSSELGKLRQIIDLDRGSGTHSLAHFLVSSAVLHFTSFPFFFLSM